MSGLILSGFALLSLKGLSNGCYVDNEPSIFYNLVNCNDYHMLGRGFF